uniref:Hexosyltransferase n=1 Tax=Paramormyrops kingsleyae TaxID=1676925 RepID=A0A3B3RMB0_9TELE
MSLLAVIALFSPLLTASCACAESLCRMPVPNVCALPSPLCVMSAPRISSFPAVFLQAAYPPVVLPALQRYVISSPRACAHRDVFLLTLVFSSPENGSRREDIRRTWANRTHIQGFMIQTLFLLGSSRSPITQAAIRMENKRYGDIIQARFIDSSRNQTPKTVLAMRWVVTYCPISRFILLTDETTFVNLQSLGEYLLTLRRHPEDLYLGRVVHQEMPDRNPSSARYLSLSQYPDKHFPDYCAGSAFVMSQDVARKVYVAAKEVASPVPYDVFVGLCVRRAGVVPMHSSRFSGQKHVRYNSCCYQFLFSSADVTASELSSIWEDLRDTRPCSLLETYSGLVTFIILKIHSGKKHVLQTLLL